LFTQTKYNTKHLKRISFHKATMQQSTQTKSSQQLEEYIRSMNEKHRQGYLIAKSHLGSSFDIEKSLGYLEWLKEREKEKEIDREP